MACSLAVHMAGTGEITSPPALNGSGGLPGAVRDVTRTGIFQAFGIGASDQERHDEKTARSAEDRYQHPSRLINAVVHDLILPA
jgi:hypothetical protein